MSILVDPSNKSDGFPFADGPLEKSDPPLSRASFLPLIGYVVLAWAGVAAIWFVWGAR